MCPFFSLFKMRLRQRKRKHLSIFLNDSSHISPKLGVTRIYIRA